MAEITDVSIIMPVKNGGEYLPSNLPSIFCQMTKLSFEVICVDSGSTDNSLDIIKKFNIRLVQIKPEEFKHGATRNMGAGMAKGKYLVFINQDAVPVNNNWLENLVSPLITNNEIAGVYSMQIPRPDCYAFVRKEIDDTFNDKEHIVTGIDYKKGGYFRRRKMIFFSTVSAVIRKDVWGKHPFDDKLLFAEDQAWAKEILENGYAIAYSPDSKVYHSHNYNFKDWFKLKCISFMTFSVLFRKTPVNLLLILPLMFGEITGNLIYVIGQNAPFWIKIREIMRSIIAPIISAVARLCAGINMLSGDKINYAK